VVLAAEQAAGLATKPVTVVPTDSIQAGLAAMVSFLPERSAADNSAEMSQVLDGVVTGEVTIASRDASLNGLSVRKGEYLGLAGEKAIATGSSFVDVSRAVAEALLADPRDVLTLLRGEDAPPLDALLHELEEHHGELEIEVHEGGQPHYPLLLSAE
jgi:dihydroxyacetone kinase-like predicted kinase